jgi:hypothetical protein
MVKIRVSAENDGFRTYFLTTRIFKRKNLQAIESSPVELFKIGIHFKKYFPINIFPRNLTYSMCLLVVIEKRVFISD